MFPTDESPPSLATSTAGCPPQPRTLRIPKAPLNLLPEDCIWLKCPTIEVDSFSPYGGLPLEPSDWRLCYIPNLPLHLIYPSFSGRLPWAPSDSPPLPWLWVKCNTVETLSHEKAELRECLVPNPYFQHCFGSISSYPHLFSQPTPPKYTPAQSLHRVPSGQASPYLQEKAMLWSDKSSVFNTAGDVELLLHADTHETATWREIKGMVQIEHLHRELEKIENAAKTWVQRLFHRLTRSDAKSRKNRTARGRRWLCCCS